jgi:hypothetical protein
LKIVRVGRIRLRRAALVIPRGYAKSKSANFSGMYAGVIGAGISAAKGMQADKQKAQFAAESETPKFGRLAYLVATADEMALIEVKSKLVTVYLGEVITRGSRSEVASVELAGGGMNSDPLTVTFKSGERWELEVPKPSKKGAKELVEVIRLGSSG